MNAVMKEPLVDGGLSVIETKSLAEILVIDDQLPGDFFTNPAYDEKLDIAIESTKGLVYSLDDIGEKAAKSDATSINKFATLFDKFIAATFKAQTETVSSWRDSKKAKTKALLANRQQLIDQFAEKRLEKLDEIMDVLSKELLLRRLEKGVKDEFFGCADLSPLVKLTGTLTEGGQLTKKAKEFVMSIATDNLAQQNKIEGRIMILENRCLRADINPPLTKAHLGVVLYADDDVFNAKVDELINAEIERRAEMEARIIKQQEAENQKKIEDALKLQQDEANRIAREKAQQEAINNLPAERPKPTVGENDSGKRITPESLRKTADHITEVANHADRNEDRNRELAGAAKLRKQADELEKNRASGKKKVTVTVKFSITVREHISPQAVANHLQTKLPDELKDAISFIEAS